MTSKTKPTLYESQREVAALRKQLAERERLAEVGERAEKGACLYRGLGLACRAESPTEAPCVACALAEKTAECERLKALREEAFQNAGTWPAEKGDAERALAESQAREAKLREELEQIELQVSSNENEPESVLANIGRMTRAALATPADSGALREVCERVARAALMVGQDFQAAKVMTADGVVDPDPKGIVARVLGGAAK